MPVTKFKIFEGKLIIEAETFTVKNVDVVQVHMMKRISSLGQKGSFPFLPYEYQLVGFSSEIKKLETFKGKIIDKFMILEASTDKKFVFSQGGLEYTNTSDEQFSLHAKRLFQSDIRNQS
ncbi:MAG: hypothetical protein Q7K55_06460 [Candidatus Levybacteria bacterium]|nr:hypothetical protein [Candidatus Levybacteria bacterium]